MFSDSGMSWSWFLVFFLLNDNEYVFYFGFFWWLINFNLANGDKSSAYGKLRFFLPFFFISSSFLFRYNSFYKSLDFFLEFFLFLLRLEKYSSLTFCCIKNYYKIPLCSRLYPCFNFSANSLCLAKLLTCFIFLCLSCLKMSSSSFSFAFIAAIF